MLSGFDDNNLSDVGAYITKESIIAKGILHIELIFLKPRLC